MDWLYEFRCKTCGTQFEDFANNREVQQNKDSVIRPCTNSHCSGTAVLLPIQLATHGHNHSSWSVK